MSSASAASVEDRTVEVRAFYRRSQTDGGAPEERTLPSSPRSFPVVVGTTQRQEIVVQVGECLADALRVGAADGGCRVGLELRLLDATGGTLVTEVAEPSTPAVPGGTVELGTVTLAEVSAVEVAPVADSRLRVGSTLQLRALAKNAQGAAVERAFRWTSSDEPVARVDQSTGLVTAVKAGGPVTVVASSGGKRGEVTLTVVQRVASVDVSPGSVAAKVNGAVQLAASPKDETGAALSDRTVQWTADNSGVFTVTPSGVVTGVRPGAGELTVTVEEAQRKVPVTVTAGGVTVAPSPASVAIGGTTPLTATVTDANGAPITTQVIAITWTSSNAGVATVDAATGVVTGRSVGQAIVTAAGGGASGQATVNVVSQVLTVAPANPTVQAARSVQLTAQGALGAVTWRSGDPAIAEISASGVVTGRRPGTVTVTATSGAQIGNTSVTVTAARVDVTPSPANVVVGTMVQLAAVVRDADAGAIPDVPVSWESGNTGVATVNPSTGAVTGVAAGQAMITARGGGASGASQVTVGVASVDSVQLTPRQPAPIPVGNTLQLTATLKDARGNPLAGRTVTFASSAPSTASVAPASAATGPTGTASTTVTAQAAGGATITAASGGRQASVAVVVSPLPPSRIEMASPDNPSCPVSTFLCQFAVKVTDSRGQPVAGALVQWDAVCGSPGGDDAQRQPPLATDAQGISATTNKCTLAVAGSYTQTAELVANGAKVTFKFTLTEPAFDSTQAVSAGSGYTCATKLDLSEYCWGRNDVGQLGNGTTSPSLIPSVLTAGERSRFFVITTGSSDPRFQTQLANRASIHTCGVGAGGTYCWGANSFGQIGDGTTSNRAAPTRIGSYTAVAIGGWHTCGLASNGAAFCWGYNEYGQLGAGATSMSSATPVPVSGELRFTELTAGLYHTCGVTTSRRVYCWGLNTTRQLGNDTTQVSRTPLVILAPTAGVVEFKSVSAGAFYTCALSTAGAVYCWGTNSFVNFATGRPSLLTGPLTLRSLSAGNHHACAIASDGKAYCWGFNSFGGLGDGTTTHRSAWVEVQSGTVRFDRAEPKAIATGMDQTCAISDFGRLFCWGRNDMGQLGDGTTTNRSRPVPVKGPRSN